MSFLGSLEHLLGQNKKTPAQSIPSATRLQVAQAAANTISPADMQLPQGTAFNPVFSPLQNTHSANPQLHQGNIQQAGMYDQQQPDQVGVTLHNLQSLIHPVQVNQNPTVNLVGSGDVPFQLKPGANSKHADRSQYNALPLQQPAYQLLPQMQYKR